MSDAVKCDHVIGWWEGVDVECGMVMASDGDKHDGYVEERFAYCPRCGERLTTATPPSDQSAAVPSAE